VSCASKPSMMEKEWGVQHFHDTHATQNNSYATMQQNPTPWLDLRNNGLIHTCRSHGLRRMQYISSTYEAKAMMTYFHISNA
jgi:hypothetical protein